MGNIYYNGILLGLSFSLIFGAILFWNRRLKIDKAELIRNRSYTVFVSAQVLTLLFMLINSISDQSSGLILALDIFGEGNINGWSILGVHFFGLIFLYMIANIFVHLIYSYLFKMELGLYDELRANSFEISLLVGSCLLFVGICLSTFVLKPFLFYWISSLSSFIPIN